MSPKLNNKSTDFPPAVKWCAWSPIITRLNSRCLLGVLTNRGALDIFEDFRGEYLFKTSVSGIWSGYCSSQWDGYPSENGEILKELRNRSHRIKFTAFTWVKHENHGFSDLFVGSLDGTITLWRVKQNLDSTKLIVTLSIDHKTEKEHITSMNCNDSGDGKCVIFVAYLDGTMWSYKLQDSVDGIHIDQGSELWPEADKIEVYNGGLYSTKLARSEELALYMIKGNILLVFYVNNDGKLLCSPIEPIIVNDLMITGFAPMSTSEFLIVTNSGKAHILVNKNKEMSLSKVQESLIRANHYSCHGVALSKSSAITIISTSFRCNYDHLIVKDVGHIVWYSRFDLSRLYQIVSENKGPLSNIWDVLEVLRIDSLFNNNEIPWSYSCEEIDTLEIIDLKNHLAILQLSILIDVCKKVDCTIKKEKEGEIRDLITSCHIFKTILSLINEGILVESNFKNLALMKKWLNYLIDKYSLKYNHTTTTAAALQEQLATFCCKEEEMCCICGGEMADFTQSTVAVCRKGHKIPRCSLSLLPCMDLPYYTCKKCNVIAHFSTVAERNNSCLFCDNTLKLIHVIMSDEENNPA